MKFWDSSALVGLFVEEAASQKTMSLASADPHFIVWWGTQVECSSAIARLEREGRLDLTGATQALQRLNELAESWSEIDPTPALRDTAIRLLRVHSLRAGDALQLAAAYIASEHHPASLEVVCLDERLSIAATKEGFPVLDGMSKAKK